MQYRGMIHAAATASQQRMPTTLDSDEINAAGDKKAATIQNGPSHMRHEALPEESPSATEPA
jgi:hypothetical protein